MTETDHHPPTMRHTTDSKQIAKNTLLLSARMLLITILNLYTVRWVLQGLGTIDYGIFTAIAGVITTSTCLSSVLALSTQRFYSFALGKNQIEELGNIFSVSLTTVALLVIITIGIFETIGIWYLESKMTIPADRTPAAYTIYQLSLCSLIFSFVQIPFMGAVFAHQHMGIYTLISTIDCTLKLLIAYAIQMTHTDALVFYTLCLTGTSFLMMMLYIMIARRKYQECHFHWVSDRKLYNRLLSFSGWTFYGTLAGVGMLQGSMILLNTFFGPMVNAAFAIGNQIYNALNTVANSVILAFRPAMIQAYAAGNETYTTSLFYTSNKVLLYLLSAIAIPMAYEAHSILCLWLGDNQVTEQIVLFAQLFMVYTILQVMHNPITILIQAKGNIKNYALTVETLSLMSFPLSWFLFKHGMRSESIFFSIIGMCSVAHIVRLFFLKHHYSDIRLTHFLFRFITPTVLIMCLNTSCIYYVHTHIVCVLYRLATVFGVSFILTLLLAYIIGTEKAERELIKSYLKKVRR